MLQFVCLDIDVFSHLIIKCIFKKKFSCFGKDFAVVIWLWPGKGTLISYTLTLMVLDNDRSLSSRRVSA